MHIRCLVHTDGGARTVVYHTIDYTIWIIHAETRSRADARLHISCVVEPVAVCSDQCDTEYITSGDEDKGQILLLP